MTEEECTEAAAKLSELSQLWQEYHGQDRLMRTLPDEKSRFVAYQAMQAAVQRCSEVSASFVRRGIPLAYDEESRKYVALTDPSIYQALRNTIDGNRIDSDCHHHKSSISFKKL